MIQMQTNLVAADNSGAKLIRVIQPVNKSKKTAGLAEAVTAAVISATPHSAIKQKKVVKAVIVRLRRPYLRQDGSVIKFDDSAAVLINPDKTPVANRISGPVCQELRNSPFARIATLSREVL